jgi:hypothetical protein
MYFRMPGTSLADQTHRRLPQRMREVQGRIRGYLGKMYVSFIHKLTYQRSQQDGCKWRKFDQGLDIHLLERT